MSRPLGSSGGFTRGKATGTDKCRCGRIMAIGDWVFSDGRTVRCVRCQLKARLDSLTAEEALEFGERIADFAAGADQ